MFRSILCFVLVGVARHVAAAPLTFDGALQIATRSSPDLAQQGANVEGAALRVRPIAMTVAVIIAGLVPMMWGTGTGSEIMRRIAAPMVGGMITAPLLSMLVIPAAYRLLCRRMIESSAAHENGDR